MASIHGAARSRPKTIPTQQSLNAAVWSVCDIMRRSNLAGALQYVPELTWLLFLRILDEREAEGARGSRGAGGAASHGRRARMLP